MNRPEEPILSPSRLLIVYSSMTGGTRGLALAARDAASRAAALDSGSTSNGLRPVEVVMREARDADGADLVAADAMLFATPENLGAMAGLMKDFFDRSYYAALDQVAGRPYALMVCAGSDGQGAVRQVERIATGLRLRQIAPPLVVNLGAQQPAEILAPKRVLPAHLAKAAELGEAMAAGLTLGLW
ncbi:MAG: NAD(P)H-dependent oxidoreductase [Quisquiliibacterium sp.]